MSNIDRYTSFISEQVRKENGYIEERLTYKPHEGDSGEKKPADPARLGQGLDRSSVKHTRVYKGGEHVATIRTHTSHGAYTTHRIIHPDEESHSGFGPKSRELTKHVEKHTGGSESIRAYKQALNKHFA